MNEEHPISISMLRKVIAHQAWDIWSKTENPSPVPDEFYQIADMAIKEVYDNVDKMITDTIRNRLEKLI
jgi:hypothetical protein